MTKLDSFVERFLLIAWGNVEDVINRLDINKLGDDDTSCSDDDSFLTYLTDDITARSCFDDSTVYTDTNAVSHTEQVKKAINTIKRHANRLGVSAEEILQSPELLKGFREQQRRVSHDAESNWRNIFCDVVCNQPTFQISSVMREWLDDLAYYGDSERRDVLGCNGDPFVILESDSYSGASAAFSEVTMDSEVVLAKQLAARASNLNRPLQNISKNHSEREGNSHMASYSTCDELQSTNEIHSDGKDDMACNWLHSINKTYTDATGDSGLLSYYADSQTDTKRRLVWV